jgi:hypothetical protein
MSRDQLAAALFQLPAHPSDTQKRFAAATAQLILRDLIQQCTTAAAKEGPGALVVALAAGAPERSRFASISELTDNLAIAEAQGDDAMAAVHRRLIERLGCIDLSTTALLLLLERDDDGNGQARLYELDAERDPAAAAQVIREIN